ncbi:MAG: hypothetical protein JSR85_00565 [Proteobacteria bacterium]|nr:hypothetical protein [Pseudomonadota bacterium]
MKFSTFNLFYLSLFASLITSPAFCMEETTGQFPSHAPLAQPEKSDLDRSSALTVVTLPSVQILVSESDLKEFSKGSGLWGADLHMPVDQTLQLGLTRALEASKQSILQGLIPEEEIIKVTLTVSNFTFGSGFHSTFPMISTYANRKILDQSPTELGITPSEAQKASIRSLSVKIKRIDSK